MQIVKVRVPAADLSRELAAMREWLDSTRYEPAKFDCNQDGVDVVLSVEFMLDEAAKAFAGRFDGVYHSAPQPTSSDSARRPAP